MNNPTFKLAATQAGLTSGTAYQCQLTSAVISPQPVFNTIPATGCAPQTQSPGKTGWQLDLAWLQDWTASPGGGLSGYAFTNDATAQWFELTPEPTTAPTVKATGQCYVVAGGFGGEMGAGVAANTTATWPLLDKPTIVTAVVLMADEADATDAKPSKTTKTTAAA